MKHNKKMFIIGIVLSFVFFCLEVRFLGIESIKNHQVPAVFSATVPLMFMCIFMKEEE